MRRITHPEPEFDESNGLWPAANRAGSQLPAAETTGRCGPADQLVRATQSADQLALSSQRHSCRHARAERYEFPAAVRVNLPPGQHELRFWLAQPLPDQYVEVDVFDGSASAFEPQPRDYVVATEAEPVVLDVEGPCALRVDELVGAETQVRYIPVTAHGPQRIAIKPDPGQAEMFVRVFQRVPSAEATLPAPPMSPPPTIAFTRTGTFIDPTNPQGMSLERVADSYQQLRALDPQALRTAFADFDAGTWSLHADYRRRFAFDEDQLELASTAKNQVEQFGELRAAYQRLDHWTGTYRQLELLAREREVGGNTFGARYHWQHSPLIIRWCISLTPACLVRIPARHNR